LTSYSQRGAGITVVGPTDVLSTNVSRLDEFSYNTSSEGTGLFDGTSAATPNVAGTASLVWSANSNLSAIQIKEIIADTAYDLGTPGYDLSYGHGFVNADAAVRRAIAVGRTNLIPANNNNFASTLASFSNTNAPAETVSSTQDFSSASYQPESSDIDLSNQDSSNLLEGSNLPTNLFDYQAPDLEMIGHLDREIIEMDLYSSPLYQTSIKS